MNVNRAIVVGFVGRDPKIRMSQAGDKIASFSIATTQTWRDKQTGERKQATEWHTVVVFNKGLAGVVEKYVKKGSRIYVEGAMKTRRFKGQDDVERCITEVVLDMFGAQLVLLDKKDGAAPDADGPGSYGARSLSEEMNDEVPF